MQDAPAAPDAPDVPVAPDASTKKPGLWTRDFSLITFVNFCLFVGFSSIDMLVPLHARTLGASDQQVGWIAAIFTLSALITRPLTGGGMDRWGRRSILLLALAAITLSTFGYALTAGLGLLFTLRVLHGLSWGGANTAVLTVASDQIPRASFGEGQGYFHLSTSLASMLSPILAFRVFEALGFSALAALAGSITLAALLLALLIHHKPVVAEGSGREVVSAPIDGAPAVSVSADGAEAAGRKRVMLLERSALIPSLLILVINILQGAISGFIALFADNRGISNAGLYFVVFSGMMLVFNPVFGWAVDRYGARKVLYPGLLAASAGMLILWQTHTLLPYILSAVILGLGLSAARMTLSTVAITQADPGRVGAANATYFTGFDAGIGVGSILAGVVAGLVGYGGMYGLMAVVPLLALVAAIFFLLPATR